MKLVLLVANQTAQGIQFFEISFDEINLEMILPLVAYVSKIVIKREYA